MSFSDTIFLFFLALILFGPKKLPEMARQAGRLLAELRRASNEFKSQIETEIAHLDVEKTEVQKNEVEKSKNAEAPQGAVASLSLNPASGESIPHKSETPATLATAEAPSTPNTTTTAASTISDTATADTIPASQESHA